MKKKNNCIGTGYEIFRPFLKIYSLLCIRPVFHGKKNVPKKGGYILAGTHVSYYDPVVVGNITIRPIHFLAKKELMDKKILGSILRFMGIIRVDRQSKNPEAKSDATQALQNNKIICLFPEGTCNRTNEELLPFKYGAVSFAYHSGKPIIPFAIINKPKAFNGLVHVMVGKPFYVKSDDYEKYNQELRNIVLKLKREGIKKYGKRRT